jgi:integrase
LCGGLITGKAVDDAELIIEQLYEKRYATGVYAEVMHDLGFRSSESIKLLTEPDRYIVERSGELVVEGLIGKGNHIYDHKEISGELAYKIQLIYKVPSYSTFYRDLKEVGVTAHGFRYTYAKEELETKLSDEAQSYHEALKEVSKELNHHREEMTKYYISRA